MFILSSYPFFPMWTQEIAFLSSRRQIFPVLNRFWTPYYIMIWGRAQDPVLYRLSFSMRFYQSCYISLLTASLHIPWSSTRKTSCKNRLRSTQNLTTYITARIGTVVTNSIDAENQLSSYTIEISINRKLTTQQLVARTIKHSIKLY